MALANKPKKSLYQVGETVYFLNGGKGSSGEIEKVRSVVSNPAENTTGIQENIYFLENYSNEFKKTDLFHSMNALMFNVKGDYLSIWGNSEQISFPSGSIISYSDYSYSFLSDENLPSNFSMIDFSGCVFDGSNLNNANLVNTILTGCSFRFAKLRFVDFTGANIATSDFRGSNLTSSRMPSNANTKPLFKATVGEGHWDPDTTIWVDGLPIGN